MNGFRLRRRLWGLALLAAGLLALPAGALADGGSAGPAQARPSMYLGRIFRVHGEAVTVPGRWFEVVGVVRPYVAGQSVELRAFEGRHLLKRATLRLKPSPRGVYGGFKWHISAPRAGRVSVVVTHAATTGLDAFKARTSVNALSEKVGFGSTGRFVQLVQQRLRALHVYVPTSGVYDGHTGWAVDAYHRLIGWGHSQLLGPSTVAQLLNGVGAFKVRFRHQGRHAEGDLSHQLLALIDGTQVKWIFPISSGKPSTPTILGSYRIYRRVPGYLPDGMYYSDFFIRGYAIHGYSPAPDYPASHGCMRLPIMDAIFVFHWLAMGDWVDTYYR
jgi:hypothetical protein